MEETLEAEERLGKHLAEEALEEGSRQQVPGDGVCDSSEDPVELAQGGLPIGLLARDAIHQLLGQALRAHQAAAAKPPQCHLQASRLAPLRSLSLSVTDVLLQDSGSASQYVLVLEQSLSEQCR